MTFLSNEKHGYYKINVCKELLVMKYIHHHFLKLVYFSMQSTARLYFKLKYLYYSTLIFRQDTSETRLLVPALLALLVPVPMTVETPWCSLISSLFTESPGACTHWDTLVLVTILLLCMLFESIRILREKQNCIHRSSRKISQ
jgi:hypothetical protein